MGEKQIKIVRTVREMQDLSDQFRREGKVIGVVPTMGFLHEGHLSLIRAARERADVVAVSIFVNPAQFGPGEDFEWYPRDFERDERLVRKTGGDVIFNPSADEMYPEEYLTSVHVDTITTVLCGASRPGHFQGVTTVCAKLFHAVKPHFAVFGQKDAQQVAVIRRMVKDLNFDLDIVVCPIVREADGLAMSSRNVYLSPEEREDALSLSQSLRMVEEAIQAGERSSSVLIQTMRDHILSKTRTRIDYVAIVHPETLEPLETITERTLVAIAVFVGKTRLIDNVLVEV